MKIEKINDNQIRCTLTSDDLASREIKLSELAYGTDKAKNLFRDMMQKAHSEFGFEADNIPLMIEAIPVTPDSIVLIITKVEDPEELDTRFSNFSQGEDASFDSVGNPQITGADDIIDIFQKIYEAKAKGRAAKKESSSKEENAQAEPAVNLLRLFTFSRLDDVIEAAHALNRHISGRNTLYQDLHGSYSLVLHQSDATPEEFNRICNMLSEYGRSKAFSAAGEAYLAEHGDSVIEDTALQQLAEI